MKVRIWGARGSIPSPLKPEAVREKIYQAIINLPNIDLKDPHAVRDYVDNLPILSGGTAGGNTPCIEIQADHETIIVDAGSGIRDLGLELMEGPCGRGEGVLHLFFSHGHWDHIQGFPYFRPAFIPGNRIYIYSVHPFDWRTEVLEVQQRSINFPVSVDYMQADMEFIQLEPEQDINIGSVKISNIKTVHPNDAYAFRFEDGYNIVVYASDAEYQKSDEASLRPYLNFFKDADVLIFDSQLTLMEATIDKEHWGHSSALIGVDLARRSGVKRLVLFHHDPTDSDEALMKVQAEAIEYQAQDTSIARPPCEVIVAYEGLTFDLTPIDSIILRRLPDEDAAIITLAPILDERRVEEFEQQLAILAETGWPSRLVIDLSLVKSLAIIGFKPLISLRRKHPDTMIALSNLSKQVKRVIKLAGFLDFFTIYPSVKSALSIPLVPEVPDRLIKKRYQIEDEMGNGWLGVVYRATDTQLDRPIAIKTLSVSFSKKAIDQFLQQTRQIIGLDHPNIVKVFECDRDQGLAYIVQELVEGHTLQTILRKHPQQTFPLEQIMDIGLDITKALEYAHGRGVIHGDLKPENVFLTDASPSLSGLKLTDFGLGRLGEGYNLLDGPLVLLTARYLAPEQILGQAIDARTDLYALGTILYQLITGHPPFKGSDQEVLRAHLRDMPHPLRKLNPKVSRSLEHFVLKLLAKDPNERYATAHQTRRILSNLGLRGEGHIRTVVGITRQHQKSWIGRQEALEGLLNCWEEAKAGHGQLALIAGETGIGKTRLTQEIASRIEMGTRLIGHCRALEGSLAYQPFIEALKDYFALMPPDVIDEDVGPLLSNVAHLVPEIHTLLPDLPKAPRLEPKQEQLRLMNSLAQYIERATQERPWLLILDDLHWADPSSLQLLHYLARHCSSIALLIIGTYRDTDLENDHPLLETLHGLQRSPGYRRFILDRLSQAEVGQMLGEIWSQTIPDKLTKQIYQVTEGNPFYVEEVAKGLVDEGIVRWKEKEWHFSITDEIRLPKTVRDAVLRRVAHLGRDTQTLLRQAAVLGRTFNFDDLREMTHLSEWTLLEHLDVALERQLIEEAPGETMLRFSHAEIQKVLYGDLSALRRRLLHRQAGEALELRYLSDPRRMAEELAHHFDEAGELEKALIYSIQAARHADDAYASQTALAWYSRALKILKQLGLQKSTQLQMFDLLLARERLHSRQGMRSEQAADLQAAQRVAQVLKDPAKQAEVYNRQAYYYRLIHNYPLASKQAHQALEAAKLAEDPLMEGESLTNLAYIAEDQGQYRTARKHLEMAHAILEKTEDRRGEAIALNGLGNLHRDINNYEQARTYYEQALEMNRSLRNRRGEATCLNNLGELERRLGNYSAACAYYGQTLGISQAIGDRQSEASALSHLSRTYLALGHYENAKTYIEQTLPIYRSIEDQVGEAEARNVLSAINYALEKHNEARLEAEQAMQIFQKWDSHPNLPQAQLLLGLALEALRDFKSAYESYHQSLMHHLAIGHEANALDARAGMARCLLAQDDLLAALSQIELSLEWLNENSVDGIEHPFQFYLTAYQVLKQAEKNDAAQELLREAHTLLQDRATQISDGSLRSSFLKNVPQNQAIVARWQQYQDKA